ncbi:CDC27 [Candida jiufengensis]|uniref:CDC27 n=1 Tax=Candida jiufengensis TaxID=497108 RepID=UPI00222420CA|nr:CDC27 [Candida jiufengensis]KAI5951079.1 CDC27 [Candida jiufengensis]
MQKSQDIPNNETQPESNHQFNETYLRSIIINSLDNLNYSNAEFASERLLSLDLQFQNRQQIGNHQIQVNLDSIYLYCVTLYRQDKVKSCYRKLIDIINGNNSQNFENNDGGDLNIDTNNLVSEGNLNHLGCLFLFGKCCLKLENKCKDAIIQFIKYKHLYEFNDTISTSLDSKFNYEKNRSILPDYASVYHLLGDLYYEINDMKLSCFNYLKCLKLNQFDFEAFQKLSKMGVDIRIKNIYKFQRNFSGIHQQQQQQQLEQFGQSQQYQYQQQQQQQQQHFKTPQTLGNYEVPDLTNPFADKQQHQQQQQQQSQDPSNPLRTPTIHVDDFNFSTPRIKSASIPDAPLRKSNLNTAGIHQPQNSNFNQNNQDLTNTSITNNTFEFAKPNFPENKKRNSATNIKNNYSKITSRLISQPLNSQQQQTSSTSNLETPNKKNLKRNNSIILENTTNTNHNNSTNLKNVNQSSINSAPIIQQVSNITTNTTTNSSIMYFKEIEKSEIYLLHKYSIFARAFKKLCKYDCYKAIKILESQLSMEEKNTPWVLSKLGKLYYEIMNYKKSESYFKKLREIDRTRIEDMEIFSTLLWHLHKKIDLTYLANEIYDINPNHPITWCIIGNLFSLNHEPDEAIRCFNKSIKLNSKFIYAYTLKGHEYFSNDNYEMSLENFRISLLLDSRHFNALYGIGMIYMNLGDYSKSDYYFRKAISINPINIILICCCGMILEKLNKKQQALKQYELACKLQPKNPLPLFKKSQLLFSLTNYTAAIRNFEILKNLAPDEASVHFLLGQLYNLTNEKSKAIKEFTTALTLDPKGNYLIKEAMESLNN